MKVLKISILELVHFNKNNGVNICLVYLSLDLGYLGV